MVAADRFLMDRYDPRTINLRHSYPEVSLKAATFGGSQWMPQGFTEAWDRRPDHQSGGSMARDATGQGFGRGWCNQRPCLPGRNRFFYKPGGLAGAENNYIIGGSQVIPPIGAEGLDRRPPAGSFRLFLGPGFRLGAR